MYIYFCPTIVNVHTIETGFIERKSKVTFTVLALNYSNFKYLIFFFSHLFFLLQFNK
uniref:Uncharacterized protein n=1 Tax=Meloidogyne enterolobii TaxID=390850 RepID=A0A6V7TVZ2_MELEN|nr:unnamed protein product [Meloidogyne enterolobii]